MATRRIAFVLILTLILAACGGDGGDTSDTAADTTGAAATTTEPPPATTAPAETTTQPEEATTTTAMAEAEGIIPDPETGVTLVPYSDENITNGDVFLYWYVEPAGGNYLALYTGPGIAGSEGQGLCPGNSIVTPDLMHVSNTPVEDGSCQDFPTDVAQVQVCSGGVWIYRTDIPGDLEGTLFGSLEWNAADGTIKGLTSQFPTSQGAPELEFGLASYSLWDGFTSDGSSVINCSPPQP